jgi:HTH-type transcriptional regulator, glycine betaine synthesis regulator
VVPSTDANEKGSGRRVALWPSEAIVSDMVGRLIEFWGFKRNMGRVWAVLYLSPDPLTAQDLRTVLRLSSGAVSMILNDLSRWGVVRKVWIQGDRRDHFAAEVQLWRMISRVLSERENTEIIVFMEACEEAMRSLEAKLTGSDARDRTKAQLQLERIKALHELARLGKKLLDGLLSTAKLDAEPLTRFLLGGVRRASSL